MTNARIRKKLDSSATSFAFQGFWFSMQRADVCRMDSKMVSSSSFREKKLYLEAELPSRRHPAAASQRWNRLPAEY
jgi:hypothetical protein